MQRWLELLELCWARTETVWEVLEAGGGGRKIGRPLLDNSAKTVSHTFDL